jgi:hypothetical protein
MSLKIIGDDLLVNIDEILYVEKNTLYTIIAYKSQNGDPTQRCYYHEKYPDLFEIIKIRGAK